MLGHTIGDCPLVAGRAKPQNTRHVCECQVHAGRVCLLQMRVSQMQDRRTPTRNGKVMVLAGLETYT